MMNEVSSSISQRSVRSSWRSSADGTLVSHSNGNIGGWNESGGTEKDGNKGAKLNSAWKRVTTLYAPSSRQTLAEDETLDLWDNNDSDFQRELAQEADQQNRPGRSAPSNTSSASFRALENVAAPLFGPGYSSSSGLPPTASQPLRPASVTGTNLVYSPSTSAVSSDRSSPFTLSSPSIGTDDDFERRRLSSSTRLGAEKGRRQPHFSAVRTDARSTTSLLDSPPRPTVEILQEPWTIWSAERRPSPPEKERMQMEALDELIRSQMRRTSANTNSNAEDADAFPPAPGSPTKKDKEARRRRRSMHDMSAKDGGAALGLTTSARSTKRQDRPTMLKTGRQQGCAIDPWSEMTPFGMIVQRPSPDAVSESASTPMSAESRSSRSGRSFREQQDEAQVILQRERSGRAKAAPRSKYRVSVVEHLTYDQARQLGLENGTAIPAQVSDTSMLPPPRPNRPEEDRSNGASDAVVPPLPPLSSASASDLHLTRSRSEAAESRRSGALYRGSDGATWVRESGGSSARTSHSSSVPPPAQQGRASESEVSAPGIGTAAKSKQAGKLGRLSKFLSGKNALALLRRPQAPPEDDEDFTQMAVDPFAHRTVIPYSTRSSSTVADVSLSKQMSATSLQQPARGQSVGSMTARSPYIQPSSARHWRSSNHLAEERAEHGPNASSTSLSASHNRRPNFGIQLQPDAAAAFDSIPLPDTPERSLSRASSVKVSLGSPQPAAEYAQRKGSFSLPNGHANSRPSQDDDLYEVNSALSHDRSTAGLPDDLPADVDEFDDFLEQEGRADLLSEGEGQGVSAVDDVEILDDGGEIDCFEADSPSSSSAVATPVSITKTETDQHGAGYAHSPSSRDHQRPALTTSLESYIFPTRAKTLADDVRGSWYDDADESEPIHDDRLSPPSLRQPPSSISPRTSVIAAHLRRPSSSSSFV